MQNDDNTEETNLETNNGQPALDEEANDEEGSESSNDDTGAPAEKLTYEQKLARATTPEEKFAIADAEANKNRRLLHKQKPKAPEPKAPSQASPQIDPVEAALLVNGMPEELLTQLKKVAKVNEVSLLKAQTDPLFVAIKEKYEKDQKQKDASLAASRGAGHVTAKKSVATPGLSREEHMKLAKEIS